MGNINQATDATFDLAAPLVYNDAFGVPRRPFKPGIGPLVLPAAGTRLIFR